MSDSLHREEGRLDDRRLEWLRNTVCEGLSIDPSLFDDMLDVDKLQKDIRSFFDAERPESAMLAYVMELEDESHASKGKATAKEPVPNQEAPEGAQKAEADDEAPPPRPDVAVGMPGELVMRVAFSDFPENITEVHVPPSLHHRP